MLSRDQQIKAIKRCVYNDSAQKIPSSRLGWCKAAKCQDVGGKFNMIGRHWTFRTAFGGVDSTNLPMYIFVSEGERQPELHLLAEFTQLFGRRLQARSTRHWPMNNLSDWTRAHGRLRRGPIEPPTFSKAEILALRRCLDASMSHFRPGASTGKIAWTQPRVANSSQIIQSIFLQRLSRIEKNSHAASIASVAAGQHD